MEKLAPSHVYSHLQLANIKADYDFKLFQSAVTALFKMTNHWYEKMDEGKSMGLSI